MLQVLNAERKEGSIEKRQAMIRGRLEERRKETDSLINPSSDTTIKASLSSICIYPLFKKFLCVFVLLFSHPNSDTTIKASLSFICIYPLFSKRFCVFLLFYYLAFRIFSCNMQDLVPWSGIEPRTTALGVWSLSHWTTREVLFLHRFLF